MARSRLTWRMRDFALAACLLVSAVPVPALAADATVRSDSPTRYTVVRGDTLWDIAGRFLEQPWLWPQVWQINPQIANPDLIYPGDIIELAYDENGRPMLRLSRDDGPASELRTVRLSPQVRREPLRGAIPAISPELLSSHISNNTVIGAAEYEAAPYLITEQEGRRIASVGDEVLARGAWTTGVITYDIVRKGRDFRDPDTGNMIGVEGIRVGSATISRSNGEQAILRIDSNELEARTGDRFVPQQSLELDTTVLPSPPSFDVNAAILAIGSGQSVGGTYDTIALNAGANAGLEVGHVLTVRKPDIEVVDELGEVGAWRKTKQVLGFDDSHKAVFPGENIGTVLVYRVFGGSSMGLVLSSTQPLRLNDRLVTP